jgi:hypothetical protein
LVDENAVEKAVDLLERLSQINSRHVVAMQSRDAILPWNKMN